MLIKALFLLCISLKCWDCGRSGTCRRRSRSFGFTLRQNIDRKGGCKSFITNLGVANEPVGSGGEIEYFQGVSDLAGLFRADRKVVDFCADRMIFFLAAEKGEIAIDFDRVVEMVSEGGPDLEVLALAKKNFFREKNDLEAGRGAVGRPGGAGLSAWKGGLEDRAAAAGFGASGAWELGDRQGVDS